MISEKDEQLINQISQAPDKDQQSKTWIKRTFAPMKDGGLRGNIFLMMVTTTGSAFFYLPIQAKKTGLVLTFLLLSFVCGMSYYSSTLLYYGFKVSKGTTYDNVMQSILGIKIGFLSNFMIFIHTFAAVVSVWLFSAEFLFIGFKTIFYQKINQQEEQDLKNTFFLLYSIHMGMGLFVFSLKGKVEILKKISMLGILFLLYLLLLFLYLLPVYYHHYEHRIQFVWWNFDSNLFVTNGFCFYLFLNQYTVIPICNNLQRIRFQRIIKVIRRTDLICLFIYICFMLIGYYSMPNDIIGTDEEKKWELFLIRPNINGFNIFVLIGQILFGINLAIAVFVKGYFLLIYFDQICFNIGVLKQYFKFRKQSIDINNDEEISKNDQIIQRSQTISHNVEKDNKLPLQSRFTNIENVQTKFNFRFETEELESSEKKKQQKKNRFFQNLIFFTVITILAISLQNYLHKFVSLIGSFVGIFEICIFPMSMILVMNQKNKILNMFEVIIILISSTIFISLGLMSFFTTLLN